MVYSWGSARADAMTLQVTGKHIEVGDAFTAYISDKIGASVEKYIGSEIFGHVRLEKERGRFRTDCSLRLRTGLLLEAHGEGADAYASADAAVAKLETRLRRYKRRLKDHHNGHAGGARASESFARDAVVKVDEEEAEPDATANAPVIIAETERGIRELSVSEAVMQLDLTDATFLVFRNAAHGGLNVVYQRPDGNVGWIDPEQQGAPTGSAGAQMSQ